MTGESLDQAAGHEPPAFDTSVAHVARVYNYWLGGSANYPADREAAEQAIAAYPDLPVSARANRAFLARAVRWLTRDAGIRQFLDIGTGHAHGPGQHPRGRPAGRRAGDPRVVYADHDPLVLHARPGRC